MTGRWTAVLAGLVVAAACSGPVSSPTTSTTGPPGTTIIDRPTTSTSAPQPEPRSEAPPEWFSSAVLYQIYVRSFADSDGDGIGDLAGVTARLDYLESLAVDVIWLLPIHPSPSVHGYDVADYTAVNGEYGTAQDLRELVEEAHTRGMRVLLDFVASHVSNTHPLFEDAYANPESAYSDWFVWSNDRHTRYQGFGGSEAMPRFNHYNEEVVDFLVDVAHFWLDLDGDGDLTDGVDGFRIDNVVFPPIDFFPRLRDRVKEANPEALLLGEAWTPNSDDLAYYFAEGRFDALFDFPLRSLLLGEVGLSDDGVLAGETRITLLDLWLEDQSAYPAGAQLVRFLTNHDTNRLASEVRGDAARLRTAATLLTALPGPVAVYYGEEIGQPGVKGGPPAWDNYRREPMDWYAAEEGPLQTRWFRPDDRWNRPADGVSVEEQDGNPGSLLEHWRRMLGLHRSRPALREGSAVSVEVEGGEGAWALLRATADDAVLLVANLGSGASTVTIPAFPFDAAVMRDLVNDDRLEGAVAGDPYVLELDAGRAVLLVGDD